LKGKIQKIENGTQIQFFHENEGEREKIADFCYQSRVKGTPLIIAKGFNKDQRIEFENQNNIEINENTQGVLISILSKSNLDFLFKECESIIMVAKTSTALTGRVVE
jgi:hypothetical protein